MLEIIFQRLLYFTSKKDLIKLRIILKRNTDRYEQMSQKLSIQTKYFFSTPFSMMITNEISEVMIFCVTEIFSYQAQIDKLFLRKYGDNF